MYVVRLLYNLTTVVKAVCDFCKFIFVLDTHVVSDVNWEVMSARMLGVTNT
jgi:hypothetical protein